MDQMDQAKIIFTLLIFIWFPCVILYAWACLYRAHRNRHGKTISILKDKIDEFCKKDPLGGRGVIKSTAENVEINNVKYRCRITATSSRYCGEYDDIEAKLTKIVN
jgi:cbb3-type cytochrome oxidase subunit 3